MKTTTKNNVFRTITDQAPNKHKKGKLRRVSLKYKLARLSQKHLFSAIFSKKLEIIENLKSVVIVEK